MDVAAPQPFSTDASGTRHISVIFNPTAGGTRARRLAATLRALAELGFVAQVVETRGPGDAERIARHLAVVDQSLLVVAGGDGTINEAVNGLLGAPGPLPPLGIVPLGTANVLAHEIGLAIGPRAAARAIAGGRRLAVRPGIVNGRHFLMMAGAGFDAAVVAGIDPARKRRLGRAAYALRALGEAWRYRFPILSAAVDGERHEARWVVVCRGRRYGGPFVVAPGADLARPEMTVCLLPGRGPLAVARYGAGLMSNAMPRLADLVALRGRTIRIDGDDGAPVQADGDIVAHLPAEIGLADREIELIVPG